MSVTSPLPATKAAHTINTRNDPTRDLNTIIGKKIAKVFSHQEKKEKADLNKFEALFISSASEAGNISSKSKASHTSNKGLNSDYNLRHVQVKEKGSGRRQREKLGDIVSS
eukprot:10241044-Ditylum_brightwellii.AAC.1